MEKEKEVTMKIIQSVTNQLKNTRVSFQRFPLSMLCALLFAISTIYMNHMGKDPVTILSGFSSAFSMVMVLGVFLFLATDLIRDSYEASWIKSHDSFKMVLYIFDLAILASMYVTIRPSLAAASYDSTWYLYFGVLVATMVACTFLGRLHSPDKFEQYVGRIFQIESIALVYSMVLYGGLSAVLFAVVHLFGISLYDAIYVDLLILIFGPFQAGVFLAGFPKNLSNDPSIQGTSFKVLIQKLLTPLLLVYTAILYLYFIKMFINQEIPSNLIRNLFIWYGIVSVACLFFHSAYQEDMTSRAMLRFYPALVVPSILVYFYALVLRIQDVGFTEPRYMGLVFGMYVFICLVYFIWRKGRDNRVLPMILVIFLLLGTIGPQGMVSVSRRSQEKRLEGYLLKNDMLKNGKIVAKSNIKEEDKAQISSIVSYLLNTYDLKDLKYFPKDFSPMRFEEVFGFNQVSAKESGSDKAKPGLSYFAFDQQEALDIQGFDSYYVLHYSNSEMTGDGDYRYFTVKGSNGDLVIYKKEGTASQEFIRIPVSEIFKKAEALQSTGSVTSPNEFSFEGKSLGQKYRLVISELSTDASQQDYYIGMILLTQGNNE